MNTIQLLISEIRFRPLNFALSLLAILTAATMFVAGPTVVSGYVADTQNRLQVMEEETNKELAVLDKKTKRIMRDIGFNLMIFHKDTNMLKYHQEFEAVDMPIEYLYRLADSPDIDKIRHLVATLKQNITWNDQRVTLAGILPEVAQAHLDEKKPMGFVIEPGTTFLGHLLKKDHQVGDTISVNGKDLKIAQILPEHGNRTDSSIFTHLSDAQLILDKPDKINEILALGCKCKLDRLAEVREQLQKALPEARITEDRNGAVARAEQRKQVEQSSKIFRGKTANNRQDQQQKMEGLIGIAVPLTVLGAAIFVGLMSWNNVRERRPEIGVLRALGKGALSIASLFIGKAIVLGLLGGLLGCWIGYQLATAVGSRYLEIESSLFQTDPALVLAAILGAPLLAAMSTYLPTLSAIMQDPATVLRDV